MRDTNMKKIIPIAILSVLLAAAISYGTIILPHTFSGNTTVPLSWLDDNFSTVAGAVNNINYSNIVNSEGYASLNAAYGAVSGNGTLLINSSIPVVAPSLSIRRGVSVIVTGKGGIVLNAPLSILGVFNAGRQTVFSGSSAVTFGDTNVVYPEWWGASGADSNDDTAAINKALLTAKDVELGRGTYYVSDTLNYYSPSARQKFYGQNPTETKLVWNLATGTQFIKMAYGGTTLAKMYIDGNSATGLAGVILADGANPAGNTFFQTFDDIYMINVPGIGINGTASGGACSNENTYTDVHVVGSSYGFIGNCPAHTFIHGEFKQSSVFGVEAGANCKIHLYGTTFTGNKQDMELADGSEVDGSGVWFENSGATGDWGGPVYGSPIAMSSFGGKVYLNIMGAHLHTYSSATYFVDLSSATSGQFNMIGAYSVPTGTVAPYSFTNKINVSPNINSNISGNTNVGTVSGTYNNFNSAKMMATPFTTVTGTSGAWGPVVQVVPSNDFSTMIPYTIKIAWSGAFSAGQTITVVGDIYGMDFLSTKQIVVSGISSTWVSPYYVPQSSIAELWMDGTYPRALNVYSSTTASITTSVTVTVTPIMVAH